MKKNSLLKFFVITCISIIIPCNLYGLDMTVGATSWYAWGEQFNAQKVGNNNSSSKIKSDPSFLYGPALAARFSNDFNFTFVFLYGNFDATKDSGGGKKEKAEFKRIDSDLALNYKLNDYFKVFIGAKYLAYDIVPADILIGTVQYNMQKVDPHKSYGGGLGASATIPITENIFGLATLSGLYLQGNDKMLVEKQTGGFTSTYHNLKLSYNEYGINTTLALAYYIAPASTVISLGGRFQYIYADYKDNEIGLNYIGFTVYGVTLSATYTFRI